MRWCRRYLVAIAAIAGSLSAALTSHLLAEPPTASGPVKLLLGPAEGTATPHRTCCSHTGGGNILVAQPAPDLIATSMTGAVVAKSDPLQGGSASYSFELTQEFEVVFDDPRVQAASLLLEARVVGLLRNPKCCSPHGSAGVSIPAHVAIHAGPQELLHVAIHAGPQELLAVTLPARSAACGESLSVYNREGPYAIPVHPGKYTLHAVFGIQATCSKWCLLSKGPSAEFAPAPALEAKWISPWEPFHGAIKQSFGFQAIVKVVPCDGDGPAPKKVVAGQGEPTAR
jgi:hypothetical protein